MLEKVAELLDRIAAQGAPEQAGLDGLQERRKLCAAVFIDLLRTLAADLRENGGPAGERLAFFQTLVYCSEEIFLPAGAEDLVEAWGEFIAVPLRDPQRGPEALAELFETLLEPFYAPPPDAFRLLDHLFALNVFYGCFAPFVPPHLTARIDLAAMKAVAGVALLPRGTSSAVPADAPDTAERESGGAPL